MNRRPKYRPGPAIRSLTAAVALIEQGQWFYWIRTNRPISPKVLVNMSLATLRGACVHGVLRLALPNDMGAAND